MYQYKAADIISPIENITIFKYSTNSSDLEHTHEFIELVYIMDGTAEHVINNTRYSVERGDLLFINFNQTHSFSSKDRMTIVNCIVKPEFVSQELVDSENASEILFLACFDDFQEGASKLISKICFRGTNLIAVESLINSMLVEFNEKAPGYRTALKGYFHVLLTKIFREMWNTDTGGIIRNMNKITPEILKYIEENCFQRITLNELAEKCFYNPSYLSRIFKDCYGMNFLEFIHEKRVNEAIRLMKETEMSMEDICYRIGYREKKQFYRMFKQVTGSTPNTMKLLLKNKCQ